MCLHVYEKLKKPRLLYRHLVWLTLISFCIPTIIAGVIFYCTAVNESLKRFEGSNRQSVSIAAGRMEKVFETVELDILKLSSSDMVQNSFMLPGFSDRFDDQSVLLDEIT